MAARSASAAGCHSTSYVGPGSAAGLARDRDCLGVLGFRVMPTTVRAAWDGTLDPPPVANPQAKRGLHMHVCHTREQYFRWLAVTKDLSPHTIRAYETRTGGRGERGKGEEIREIERDNPVEVR